MDTDIRSLERHDEDSEASVTRRVVIKVEDQGRIA